MYHIFLFYNIIKMYLIINNKNNKKFNIYDFIEYENNNRPYGIKIYKNKKNINYNFLYKTYEIKENKKLNIYNINNINKLNKFINKYGVNNTINWNNLYNDYDGYYIDNYDKIIIKLLKSKYLLNIFSNINISKKIINKYEWFINNNSNNGYIWNLKNININ